MKRILLLSIIILAPLSLDAQITKAEYSYPNGWGFKNNAGEWVVQPQYKTAYWDESEKIGTFCNKYANEGGLPGLLDATGKTIFPIGIYKKYYKDGNYIQITNANNKIGLATLNGKVIIPCQWNYVSYRKDDGFITVIDDNKKRGLYTQNGVNIIPCNWKEIYYARDGFLEVADFNGKRGIYSTVGKEVIPALWKSVWVDTRSKCITVTDFDNKVGLYTLDGKSWVPCQWKSISVSQKYKYISVIDFNNKEGFLDFSGNVLIPCKWVTVFSPDKGFIKVRDSVTVSGVPKEILGLYALDGKVIVPCKWKEIWVYDDEYIEVVDYNGKTGAYSLDGKELLPCEYTSILYMKEKGYIEAKDGNVYKRLLKLDGTPIIPLEYSEFIDVFDGIYPVKKNGKWGYFAKGKEIIPCEYDDATAFKNDVATVKKDGEVKLIKNPLKDGSNIQIAENTTVSNKKKKGGPVVSRYPAPNSDVDKNIPTGNQKNENTFAFIIANENYPDAPVPYSLNDGRIFKEYCQKTLCLPEKNINLYEDATFGTIIGAVEKMKSIADAYDGDASVIFYYAGHGFPDEKNSTAYLLPVDGNASDITTTGYSLAKLYGEISKLKLKKTLVLLDACFSGAKREDKMLASSRGVAIKVKDEAPQGNMVVFSAAEGDETAHQLEEKGHGLFTYYLLKELQQTDGNVSLGDLTDFVTKQVKRQSVVINNKKQTPTVIPSTTLADSWRSIKL